MEPTKKKIPALRFPEFKGEWKKNDIDAHIDFLTGFPFKGEDISEDPTGIALMRGVNITEGAIRHSTDIDRYYSGSISKLEKYFLKIGDLVIGMDGSKVGRNSAIIGCKDSNSILVQRVARLREKDHSSLPFIYHHVNSVRFHKYVDEVKTSSGIPHISPAQIKGFKVYFPTLQEQQKIALFLTAVDDKIKQLQKKKLLLEQYKKGVMQQIFTQQLRFKDDEGKDYPEWEEKALGELLDYEQPTKYIVKSEEYDNKYETPVLTAGKSFILGYTYENHGIYTNPLPVIIFDDFTTSSHYVNFHFKVKSSAMKILKPKNEFIVLKLVHELLKAVDFVIGGHKRHWISEFQHLTIMFPCFDEQKKIADFISGIDTKIKTVQIGIEQTQNFKKGLLQEMFV